VITLQERVHSASKPADWQLDKLHQVFRVRKGHKNEGMKEDNLLSLSYGRIVTKDINTSDGLLPENFEGYQIVENGNIVLRLTDLQNDKRSLRQGLVTQRGIITSAYDAVEVCRDNDPRFWFYVLLALDIAKHYYSLGGGVRQSIKFSDFPNDWVYRPDLPTQRAIADFLDRETARIDLLIEKKQRLVELLGEKRSAVITSAVTGDARSRDRLAVEGGGGVKRLRFGLSSSPRVNARFKRNPDALVSFAPMDALEDGLGGLKDLETKVFSEVVGGSYNYFEDGDVLLAKVTPCFENGKKAIAGNLENGAGFATSEVLVLRPHDAVIERRYLRYIFCSEEFRNKAIASMTGSGGLRRVSERAVLDFPILITDLYSQRAIADFLDRETARIDHIRDKTRVSIDRLREYRSSLITAAVTGQVDVSKWVKAGTAERRLDAVQATVSA